MRFLITGGCGFLGSNLASEVLRRRGQLCIVDNFSRTGSSQNHDWLSAQGRFEVFREDIRNCSAVDRIVHAFRPNVVFHLAGQVAMTTSIENPRLDFETNAIGGHNVLEAVRRYAPEATLVYSSTNKVYGELKCRLQETETRYVAVDYPGGFSEDIPLDFQGPYGCSKGAVDQYMLDYARVFGLRTVVFRHSTIFGGRQYATVDQGWIGWFIREALSLEAGKRENIQIAGNGKQVRDVLFVSDLVRCYFDAVREIEQCRGNAFNIGGGIANSLSIIELFGLLSEALDMDLRFEVNPWRQSDQRVFVARIEKARKMLKWQPRISKENGLEQMVAWVKGCC